MLTVRYFAAAKQAAGRDEEHLRIGAGATISTLLSSERFAGHAVFARCSFLVDGVAAHLDSPLDSARSLDVLPPFAGG